MAFGGNLRTGMVGVSAAVDADSASEAVIAVIYLLGWGDPRGRAPPAGRPVRVSAGIIPVSA